MRAFFWLALSACGSNTKAVPPLPPGSVAVTGEVMVTEHNAVRAAVGVSGLTWDNSLALYAQAWADELKARTNDTCDVRTLPTPHRPSTGAFAEVYGENIAWYAGQTVTDARVVSDWASEKSDYDYASNSCASGKVCGHYTQLVWRSSTRLGCATVTCNQGGGLGLQQIWVCNYDPRGNENGTKPY